MKRFSKALVTLLVVITILGTLSVGFAAPVPSDVKGTNYEEAVNRLAALNILSGFPDGTFKPGDSLTRAQAARVVVSALGLAKAADIAKGATQFTDVPADHWASGYINIAVSQGIIAGMGDGTFQPEAQVTYAQILSMMLRALNYGPALKKAVWPTGIIAKADDIGLTEDVNVAANVPATRGDVAIIVNNALTLPMLKQTGYGDFETYEPDVDADGNPKTTLLTKLGLKELEKQVEEISRVNDTLAADEVIIDGKTYTLPAGSNPEAIFGHTIKAWYNNDNEIIFFVDKTDADDVLVGRWVSYSSDYTVDNNTTVYNDNVEVTSNKAANFESNDYGTFIVDPKTDKVVFADKHKWDLVGLVESTNASKLIISTDAGRKTLKEDGLVVVKDGTKVEFSEIQPNDIVYIDDTNNDYVVIVRDVVTGKVTKANADYLYIDGESIRVSTYGGGAKVTTDGDIDSFVAYNVDADANNITDLLGEEVTVYKDIIGRVYRVVGEVDSTSASAYALVTKQWTSDEDYVKLWKTDDTVATYVYDGADPTLVGKWIKFSLNSDGEIDSATDLGVAAPQGVNDVTSRSITLADNNTYRVSSDTVVAYYKSSTSNGTMAWADIKDAKTLTGMQVWVIDEDSDDVADFLLVTDKGTAGSDYEYAVVYGKAKTADGWEVTFQKADGTEQTLLAADTATENFVKTSTFQRGTSFKYHLATNGEIVIDSVYVELGDMDKDAAGAPVQVKKVTADYIQLQDNSYLYFTDDTLVVDVTDMYTYDEAEPVEYSFDKTGSFSFISPNNITGNYDYVIYKATGSDLNVVYVIR